MASARKEIITTSSPATPLSGVAGEDVVMISFRALAMPRVVEDDDPGAGVTQVSELIPQLLGIRIQQVSRLAGHRGKSQLGQCLNDEAQRCRNLCQPRE